MRARKRAPSRRAWIAAPFVILVLLGIAYFARPKPATKYATVPLVRESLVAFVTATGTVNPQNTISVGTQVSGTISVIAADFNDHVSRGQVLARLDPTLLQATLNESLGALSQAQSQWQAAVANARGATSTTVAAYANADAVAQNVRVARAATISADADVEKDRAALTLAKRTIQRDRALLGAGYIAQNQYDTDDTNQVASGAALRDARVTASQARMQLGAAGNLATAGTAQGSASSEQATGFAKTAAAELAAVSAAQALVAQGTINLKHTVITSPVNGTVIARNISVGQTVAASFQTPTLYTIAQDLGKMEIDVAVGEPDIGSVRAGQTVDFTVLAFPNSVFVGTVAQVRENPTTIANVVTYDTVVYVGNADGRLRPGMTASAEIEIAHAQDALVVPLAALSPRIAATATRASGSTTAPASLPATSWGNTGSTDAAPLVPGSLAQVGLVDGDRVREVPVTIVLVSAGEAAIEGDTGELSPGTPIVVSAPISHHS